MRFIINLTLLTFFLISPLYANNHYPITRDSKVKIMEGKTLYNENCASCHQINLAGAPNWQGYDEDGHRLPPPLDGTGHTWHHSDEQLHSIIKYGLAKLVKNYEGKMIGFGEILNDRQIDSILAYLKSYWGDDKYEFQIKLSKK